MSAPVADAISVESPFSSPACQSGALAPVANEPIESGHPVEVGQGVGRRAEQEVLGPAAGVGAVAQVDRRLGRRVVDRGTRGVELHHRQGADDLGVAHDQVAGRGRGTGEGARGHRHEAGRQPRLDGQEGSVEGAAIVGERADRALHDREERPLAQRVAAAGDGRRHLDRRRHLAGGDDALGLHVLGRVAPDGVELVKGARLGRHVLGRDGHPVEGDLVERVGDAGDGRHVGQGGAADLAGLEVLHLDAAAVGAGIHVTAVERQVLGRIASARGRTRPGRSRAPAR